MRRSTRFGLLAAVIVSLAFGLETPSKAGPGTFAPAYTFVLPCENSATQSSAVPLASGNYRATITGACTLDGNWYTITTSTVPNTTPCSVTSQGIPCVGPLPNKVSNVPGQACWTVTGSIDARPCDDAYPTLNTQTCSSFGRVLLDGVCYGTGDTFTFTRGISGAMSARLYDSYYFDNRGALVVTVVRLP